MTDKKPTKEAREKFRKAEIARQKKAHDERVKSLVKKQKSDLDKYKERQLKQADVFLLTMEQRIKRFTTIQESIMAMLQKSFKK